MSMSLVVGEGPGVLVLHGGAGPTPHEHERARRLAELGYAAYVPDLFGGPFRDRAHGIEVITKLVAEPGELRARVGAAAEVLAAKSRGVAAVIGFCFGGLAALEYARCGADVACVASFHGGLQTRMPAVRDAVRARVLAFTGADDPHVTHEHRVAFEQEMTAASARWQLVTYGGVQHGFTEDTTRPGCAYDAHADHDSWRTLLAAL